MERRKFTREFKLEAVRLIKDRGVSYVQASQDLNVHTSQLRDWVKRFSADPQHAFPGNGQMKPEQLEILDVAFRIAGTGSLGSLRLARLDSASTTQALTDSPSMVAESSMTRFRLGGRRSVIRASNSSSGGASRPSAVT